MLIYFQTTFRFGANYWTTNNVYNDVFALRQDFFDGEQAKFDAYNKMPFTRVCIGMKAGNVKNFGILITKTSTSLLAYIGSGASHSMLNLLFRLNLITLTSNPQCRTSTPI